MIAALAHASTYGFLIFFKAYHLCMLLLIGDIIIYLIIKHNSNAEDFLKLLTDIKLNINLSKTLGLVLSASIFLWVFKFKKQNWQQEQSADLFLLGLAASAILAMSFMYYKFIIEKKE